MKTKLTLILHSVFLLVGLTLIVFVPITGEIKPLIGGIILTAIASWNLIKQLRKQQAVKQNNFEQTLDAIRRNEHIKL